MPAKHLQPFYFVPPGGDETVCRLERLTPSEIRDQAAHQRELGEACLEHADELERYLSANAETVR